MRPSALSWLGRRFWDHIRSGLSARDAAAAVGVSEMSGQRWFADAGGVRPQSSGDQPRQRPRLSFEEREEIALGMAARESIRSIAKRLGRAPSTISREIAKNGTFRGVAAYRSHLQFGATWRGGHAPKPIYKATVAHHRSAMRAARPKPRKLAMYAPLREQVQTRDLHTYLRTGRAIRHPRCRPGDAAGGSRACSTSASDPPRSKTAPCPGIGKGDLILGGTESGSAIGTLVERTTRFTMLLHLSGDHTAATVQDAIVAKMTQLPARLRKSLTWDQGKEMANHLATALKPQSWISTSAIHTHRGSAEATKTPTDCCASGLPKALTYQYFRPTTSTTSPPNSTIGHARRWAGKHPLKHCTNYCATRPIHPLLQPPRESALKVRDIIRTDLRVRDRCARGAPSSRSSGSATESAPVVWVRRTVRSVSVTRPDWPVWR